MKERLDDAGYKQIGHFSTEKPTTATARVMFQPKCGYCTGQVRDQYIRQIQLHDNHHHHLDQNKNMKEGRRNSKQDDHHSSWSEEMTPTLTIDEKKEEKEENGIPTESLIANPDVTQPLYFWQLYSILGREPILNIIRDFYTSINKGIDITTSINPNNADNEEDDDEKWFRNAFKSSSCCMLTSSSSSTKEDSESTYLEGAIHAHASYWIDVFGGGDVFHGGEHRLEFTHKYYATSHVMNARGAKLWMKHMRYALRKNLVPDSCSIGYRTNSNNIQSSQRGEGVHNDLYILHQSKHRSEIKDVGTSTDIIHHDPRILPGIMDFLRTKMKHFSEEYCWILDESDFVIDDFDLRLLSSSIDSFFDGT